MPTLESLQQEIDDLKREIKALITFKEKMNDWISEQQGKMLPQNQQNQPFKGIKRNKP